MVSKRKYDANYIKFGFMEVVVNKETRPQCVICATILSNDALKPAKLERHLKSKHPTLSEHPKEFFEGKRENFKKMKLGPGSSRYETSEKALCVSFHISQMIAESKKPHTIGETLVKPCLLKATEEMLGKEAAMKMTEIPLSNNTVKSRIGKMSDDIQVQLLDQVKKSPYFALQCDESTDVANCSQLLVYVRYINEDNLIREDLLLSEELETTSKEPDTLLFHTEVRWLSRGNMLACLFELREELKVFLLEQKYTDLYDLMGNSKFEFHLAYLVDIFSHLNQLNLQLQGGGNQNLSSTANVFIFEDKLRAFLGKIDLWISKVKNTNFSTFLNLKALVDQEVNKMDMEELQANILLHLEKLKDEFKKYFPEYATMYSDVVKKMIRNPFNIDVADIPEEIQEELIELQNDTNLKDNFQSGIGIEEFWCKKAVGYRAIRDVALRLLVVFSTTYLCEQGFSTLLTIKSKQRNKLCAKEDMRLALSKNIKPIFGKKHASK